MRRAAPSTILRKLQGGDRRSCGRTAEVVEEIRNNPRLLPKLVRGLTFEDPLVRMRAADALEKVTRTRPDRLPLFKKILLRLATESGQQEIRWHLAQILPRLPLAADERRALVATFRAYLRDQSSIVKTCALQALADLAVADSSLRRTVRATIRARMVDGTPAMQARGRKLLTKWPARSG
jgi:hypothetical protein